VAAARMRGRLDPIAVIHSAFRTPIHCLNEHTFTSVAAARLIIAEWQLDYNNVRPYSGFGGLSPAAYVSRPNPGHRGPSLTYPLPENGEQVRERRVPQGRKK